MKARCRAVSAPLKRIFNRSSAPLTSGPLAGLWLALLLSQTSENSGFPLGFSLKSPLLAFEPRKCRIMRVLRAASAYLRLS